MTERPADSPRTRPGRRPHVVVLGGGFGGLAAVRALKGADVDITLIDRHTYNVFQPLIYQVATAALNPGDVTWFLRSIRSHQKNVRFVRGSVLAVDTQGQTVTLDGNATARYDYLVVAIGVTANFFGIPGAEKHSLPLYRRSQAIAVRDRLFAGLETAAATAPTRDLRIVVVGGGATGVETAGALAEMRNIDLPVTYPELDPKRMHITLVEMSPHVLGPFHPKLRSYAKKALLKRGVDLRLQTAVKEAHADGVLIVNADKSEFLDSHMVIWASGVIAPAVVAEWGLPQGSGGRIEVDEHRRVRGLRNVFAVGDIAIDPKAPLPQLAQPALQGGRYVAKVIGAAAAAAPEPKPFRYVDKGTMATVGRASAIAQITGLPRLKGFPAWVIWVAIHIQQLLGNRNRIATMANLSLKYLDWRNHNVIVGETPAVVSTAHRVIDTTTAIDEEEPR